MTTSRYSNRKAALALVVAAGLVTLIARGSGGQRFLLVTGGWSPTSNNERYERYLQIFNNAFGGRATMLFGAGQGTPMLPTDRTQRFDRDDYGALRLSRSTLPGPIRPGTVQETIRLFDETVASRPDSVTAVFGDHGGTDGVAMWNQQILTGEHVNQWYRSFPEATTVRSIHLHCYGGAVVVPRNRTQPTRLDQWANYLRLYYPLNKCALAASSEDEVSYSLGSQATVANNPWTRFFRDNPRPSLDRVKRFLAEHPDIVHLPVTTSDYLIQDLTRFLCRDAATTGAPKMTHGSSGVRPVDTTEAEVCSRSTRARSLQEATARLRAQDEVTDDIGSVIREMAMRFIESRAEWRDRVRLFREARSAVQRRLALLAARSPLGTALGKSPEEINPLVAAEIEAMRNGPILDYQRLLNSITEGEGQRAAFLAFLQSPAQQSFMASADFRTAHPQFTRARASPSHQGRNIFELEDAESEAHMGLQTQRRRIGLRQQLAERTFVESRLNLPGMENIRRVYESIRNCERSQIN